MTENTGKPETAPEKSTVEQPKSPKKGGGCLKVILILVILFVLLIAGTIGAGWWALNKFLGSSAGSNLPPFATIEILSGTAEKASDATNWQEIKNGETVANGTSIKTDSNSQAAITFPSGSQLRLDENTQITLSTSDTGSTSLTQSAGRTWSRIGKVLGQTTSYEIESQTTLATVRGTAFTFIVAEEESMVDTDDGQVEVAAIEKVGQERKILSKITVEKGYGAGIFTKDLGDLKTGQKQLIKIALTEEFKNSDWVKGNRERDVKFLEQLKNRRKMTPLEMLKLIRNTSPQDVMKIQDLARRIGSGEIDLTETQETELKRMAEKVASTNAIDDQLLTDAANWLANVDPSNFSDTKHWKNGLRAIIPVLKKSGVGYK